MCKMYNSCSIWIQPALYKRVLVTNVTGQKIANLILNLDLGQLYWCFFVGAAHSRVFWKKRDISHVCCVSKKWHELKC